MGEPKITTAYKHLYCKGCEARRTLEWLEQADPYITVQDVENGHAYVICPDCKDDFIRVAWDMVGW
jgi:hypothetical protein